MIKGDKKMGICTPIGSSRHKDTAMKKKRRFLLWLIPLLVVLVLAAIIAGLLIWQKQNVDTVFTAMTSTKEEIEEAWEAQQQTEQKFLEDYEITFTPPSTEQNEALMNGLTTAKKVKEELGLIDPADDPAAAPSAENSAEPAKEPSTPQALVDKCVRELYILRIDLIARLGELRADAINTWEGFSEAERTRTQKANIILDGLRKCSDLEVEIDDKVLALLDEYRTRLSAMGADTAVMDELWQYYCEDKATTKAYYLNQYL